MSPEYGATCTIFPIDDVTLDYSVHRAPTPPRSRSSRRTRAPGALARPARAASPPPPRSSSSTSSTVEPSLAGPSRPQDRVALAGVGAAFARRPRSRAVEAVAASGRGRRFSRRRRRDRGDHELHEHLQPLGHGRGGARREEGRRARPRRKPWVKTSLAPGSRVVIEYLERAGCSSPRRARLLPRRLRLHDVHRQLRAAPRGGLGGVDRAASSVAAVLSGNRNFEGRIHPDVRQNYLASPPLVVAYALAGTIDIDLDERAARDDERRQAGVPRTCGPRTRRSPSGARVAHPRAVHESYATCSRATSAGRRSPYPQETFAWDPTSTYVLQPPFFDGITTDPAPVADIVGARVLAILGDSVTTDHISPPAPSDRPCRRVVPDRARRRAERLQHLGRGAATTRSWCAAPSPTCGSRTCSSRAPRAGSRGYFPGGETTTIFEASERLPPSGTPLLVIAGAEYGTGSSRDWAAKGPLLLGVRAGIAVSYERIHRSNLIGMGIAPLQFQPGESLATYELDGWSATTYSGSPRSAAARCRRPSRCARPPTTGGP